MLEIINKKLTKVEDFLIIFSGVSIFIVMILTSFQIISRVMGYPWPGYLELSELSISIFAFLGVAYAQRVDSHIRMELIVGNLKGRIRWFLEFCATFLSVMLQTRVARISTHFDGKLSVEDMRAQRKI